MKLAATDGPGHLIALAGQSFMDDFFSRDLDSPIPWYRTGVVYNHSRRAFALTVGTRDGRTYLDWVPLERFLIIPNTAEWVRVWRRTVECMVALVQEDEVLDLEDSHYGNP